MKSSSHSRRSRQSSLLRLYSMVQHRGATSAVSRGPGGMVRSTDGDERTGLVVCAVYTPLTDRS